MRPERLLASYLWHQGVCWRCGHTDLVAAVGELWSLPLTACGVCLLRLDQIAAATRERAARAPLSPPVVPASTPNIARAAVDETALRTWLRALMEPVWLPDGSATGSYTVRGSQIPTGKHPDVA